MLDVPYLENKVFGSISSVKFLKMVPLTLNGKVYSCMRSAFSREDSAMVDDAKMLLC